MRIATTISLLALLWSSRVTAWGEIGHRTVAYLARMYFTEDAEALFQELVKPTDTFDISDGAVWPDNRRVQGKRPWSKPWHYIDAKDEPPKKCRVNYNSDCNEEKGCVVSAIANLTGQVNNSSLAKEEQNEAFKFLLHFIGDITQPLHTEDKCRGGTRLMVQWGKPGSKMETLHEVWDALIIKKLINYKAPRGADPDNVNDKGFALGWAEELKEFLDNSAIDLAATECVDIGKAEKCALKWAGEANKFVCSYAMKYGENLGPDDPNDDDDCQWEWKGPGDLSKEYHDGAVPIVTDLVAKAGWRLGAWVNALAEQRKEMVQAGVRFHDAGMGIQGEL